MTLHKQSKLHKATLKQNLLCTCFLQRSSSNNYSFFVIHLLFFILFCSTSFSQTTLYSELFSTNGITNNCGQWSTNYAPLSVKGDGWQTENLRMSGTDIDGTATSEVIWYSESINISGQSNVSISANFGFSGLMSNLEYIKAFYKIDGGSEILWFDGTDDIWAIGVKSISGLSGTSLEIVIRAWNTGLSDVYHFDDVTISDAINGNLWLEDFNLNNVSSSCPKWWTLTPFTTSFRFMTATAKMEAINLGVEAKWESDNIDINGYVNVTASAFFEHNAAMENSDYIKAYYILDGGPEILWFDGTDDTWTSGNTFTLAGLSGSNLQIVVRVLNGLSETYWFDNVTVTGCPVGIENYAFQSASVSLCNDFNCAKSDYTFTQTNDINCKSAINQGVTATATFPSGTDATTCTGGTFNGEEITAFTLVSATQIDFTVPSLANAGVTFNFVLKNIQNGNITAENAAVSIPNASGGVNSYATYTFSTIACPGTPADFTFGTPSLSLSSPKGNCYANYTFTQSILDKNAFIPAGATAIVNFMAGTDATTMTGGIFNGVAINMGTVSTTPTSVTFTTSGTSTGCGAFSFTLNNIKNPDCGAGLGSASVAISNITGGTDSYSSYNYAIAMSILPFFDYNGESSYALADGAGKCYYGLLENNVYCFNFIKPNTSTNNIRFFKSAPCAGASTGSGAFCLTLDDAAFSEYEGCNLIYNGGYKYGYGCAEFSGDSIYTICFKVPPGCDGMNLCPLTSCNNDPPNCGSNSVNNYWVGGSGSWDDATHWSNASGGTGGACIPNIKTNVYIENNSGTQPYTITMPVGIWYTKSFYMTGEGAKTPVIGQGSLLPRPNGQ